MGASLRFNTGDTTHKRIPFEKVEDVEDRVILGSLPEVDLPRLHTPQLPPFLAQYLQPVQFLQALQ
ncbi:hypothetical protein [Leeuwenhoekiella marinoflava]|uniref:hypothetical protein n=1 Tax=Leeuwenhoekiella marinoflava TaxID=988 RepID=UPI003002A415